MAKVEGMTPAEARDRIEGIRMELRKCMRAVSVPGVDWDEAERRIAGVQALVSDLRTRALMTALEVRQMPRGKMPPRTGATYMGSHGESYTFTETMPDGSARVVQFDEDAGESSEAVVDASTALRMAADLDLVSCGHGNHETADQIEAEREVRQ